LFAYCPTVCSAEGTNSSRTRGQTGARSVVTSAGTVPARSARLKKRPSGRQVTARRHQDVDDLAMLIDRPVEIGPLAGVLQIGLIDEPPVTRSIPARPRSLDELRGETLHPPVDGHVINGHTALGQQLLDIPTGRAIPQVPADPDRDHLPREPETSKDRDRTRRAHRTVSSQSRSTNATVPWHRPPGGLADHAAANPGRLQVPREQTVQFVVPA
jgi:hypothetical protein